MSSYAWNKFRKRRLHILLKKCRLHILLKQMSSLPDEI